MIMKSKWPMLMMNATERKVDLQQKDVPETQKN